MATPKKRAPKKRAGKYEDKSPVDASFMEIIQAVVKDAEKKPKKIKNPKK